MELLKTLNEEQKRAVTHGDGPLLIVAGAGTGKTTVITQRIAWLIAQGKAQSDEILAVTFTDKAAGEMSERVDQLLPLGYLDLWISTFHSFCQRVLSEHALDIGLPGDFKLLDQTGQWLLIREHFDRFDLDYYRPLGNPTKFIHALLQHFSRAKDEAISPAEYLEYVEGLKLNMDSAEATGGAVGIGSEASRLLEVANAYHVYQQLLLENNALDFGDLITYTLKLFGQRPQVLEHYRTQFKYILVDEFQDTNWAQYELIKLLASPRNNLTVVADDDQSIYKFRGASVSNLTQFRSDFPTADIVSIVTNYRSRQDILDRAHAFIQLNNPNRLEAQKFNGDTVSKKLKAARSGNATVEYLLFEDRYAEAEGVVRKITNDKLQMTNGSWNDFAILVRANSQADLFVAELERAGIPYQYVASRGLYTKRIILDIINFLKLLDDYHESPALWRVLNWPVFSFPIDSLVDLNHLAHKKSWSLYQTLEQALTQKDTQALVREEIRKIITLIHLHAQLAQRKKPREVILSFLEQSGYLKHLAREDSAENRQEFAYLDQFDAKARAYEADDPTPTVQRFLQEIRMELDSGEAGALSQDLDSGPEAVKVMTVHASKGLEFGHVFIVNMVDKRFPSIERSDPIRLPDALVKETIPFGDVHLQEERRLLYVAMTRAKEGLYFTAAQDYGGKTKKKPSKFLYELELVGKEITPQPPLHKGGIKGGLQVAGVVDTSDRSNMLTAYQLPAKFSFTQMKAFETCPYQYRFAHILKVPVRANYTLSFGKSMHATLKRFFEAAKERAGNVQADLFGGNQRNTKTRKHENTLPSLEELLKIYREEWIDEWYESAKHQEEYRAKGKRILTEFYARALADPPKVLYLERGFNLKVQDPVTNEKYTIFGVIDRIDALPPQVPGRPPDARREPTPPYQGGDKEGVEILDYKTGSVKSEETIEKEQLLLYQIAAQEVLGLKPLKLTYYYLDEQKPVSFLGTSLELEKLKSRMFEFIEKVQQSHFKATPSQHACAFCDYRNICEYRAV